MKILYVNTYYNGGGAEKVMRQLYMGNKTDEVKTYCMVGRYQKNLPENIEVIYTSFFDRALTTLVGGCVRNTLLKTNKAKRKIIDIIQKEHIDIVHFHNIHSNYLGITDIAEIQKYCKSIIITVHDMWLVTGGCAHACECEKWFNGMACKSCLGNYSMKKFSLAHYVYIQKKQSFSNKDIIYVTPSKWIYDVFKKSYLCDERVRIIDNGIDLKKYCVHSKKGMREKYKLPLDKNLILFVANGINNIHKGFIYLKKALEKLSDKDKYAMIIVGNREEENIELPFDMYKMGYISSEQMMSELYSAADVYIHPSMADISSFTAMEAMASGTPVIAFRTGGIPEIVNEENGWLVEPKNVDELSNCIEEAFRDRKKLESKAELCREYVEKNRSIEKTLDEYKKLYYEIKE